MATLYIVRHGETEENHRHVLQGQLPGTLTDEGRRQVAEAAKRLVEMKAACSQIISSDLKRAIDSAGIIAAKLHLPIVPMPLLRERDWGEFNGIPIDEARERFLHDGEWVFPPDTVETEDAVYQRAKDALLALARTCHGDSAVVVTHGLFARNLIAAHFGLSPRMVKPLENAEVRILEL